MAEIQHLPATVSPELLDAIKAFPHVREVEHCGGTIRVEPFDIYAECPECRQRMKVRAFSASGEVEDVFDAVFAWMASGGDPVARRRIEAIRTDLED